MCVRACLRVAWIVFTNIFSDITSVSPGGSLKVLDEGNARLITEIRVCLSFYGMFAWLNPMELKNFVVWLFLLGESE